MAAVDHSDWSSDSTEAFNLSLVAPDDGALRTLNSFKPEFTYALFDEESIFGYQGLKINLRYNACDMRPNVQIKYDKKFKALNETEALDVEPILKEFLPDVAFKKSAEFEGVINSKKMYDEWTPPGSFLRAFDIGDSHFEVWRESLAHPAAQSMLKRIQLLVPFFVDGGTIIDLEHDMASRWTVFFLYEVKKDVSGMLSPYVFIGYSTVYRYYIIHDVNKYSRMETKKNAKKNKKRPLLDFKLPLAYPKGFAHRARISQFLILPPFQKSGHGSRLYSAIYSHYARTSNVVEITVEDPNEDFDNLRDLNDLDHLRKRRDFMKIAIDPSIKINKRGIFPLSKLIDHKFAEKVRVHNKIAPRQFARMVEAHLLSQIPTHIRQSLVFIPEKKKDIKDTEAVEEEKKLKHVYHLWQLMVKCRLHKHNRDMLMQIDRPERADKLEAAAASVEEGYAKLLSILDKRAARDKVDEVKDNAEANVDVEIAGVEKVKGNNKRPADDDSIGERQKSKKAKFDVPTSMDSNVEGGEAPGEKTKDVEIGNTKV